MRLLILAVLFPLAALAQPAPWALDPSATELVVKVWKAGAAASLAHDHIVRASRFSGQATLDEAGAPESLRLELTVEVAGLVPDEPELRRRHHLPNTPVPENDRKKIRDNLQAEGQLDGARFPTLTFVAQKVFREDSGALQCLGTLTLHGVTKELLFPITVKTGEGRVEGEARVRLKTSDFGVKPYRALLGLIRNKDEVELVLHVVLRR